jgi:PAS domain S-box-containing protein
MANADATSVDSAVLLDQVFEAAGVGLCLLDANDIVLRANARWLGVAGVPSGAAVGRSIWDLLPAVRAERQRVHDEVRAGKTVDLPGSLRWRRGSELPHEERLSPVRLAQGIGILITAVDVSDRKRAEEACRESEERFRIMADGSPFILWVTDSSGGNLFVNRKYRETFDVTIEEVEGRKWQPLIHPDDAPTFVGDFLRAVRERAPFRGETRVRRKDGEWRWVDTTGEPRFSAGGEFLGHVGVTVDVTEQRALEAQVRQSQKLESVGRLAGGIAHDFNNLLTVISSCVEALKEDVAAGLPAVPRDIEEIASAARRAGELTRQLLGFARKQAIAPVPLDLSAVVRDAGKLLARVLPEDVELVTAFRPGLWTVRCDPGQIEQVILNLAINARDAMPRGGRLTFETGNVDIDDRAVALHPFMRAGAYVRLRIGDTGVGMTPEVRAHVFEPFFTTKAPGKGTGLGLAMVYGIVKQSGGYVLVDSEPGRGTTFEIYFPRCADAKEAPSAESAIENSSGTETILVVEDDVQVRNVAVRGLMAGGYRVLAAADGHEALGVAAREQGPVHLLVTDVMMPGLNGRELANELHRRRERMRVLYVSGYPIDVISPSGVIASDVELLKKPFTTSMLLARVRAVLDAGA